MSEVLGTLMMGAVTVGMAVILADLVEQSQPQPLDKVNVQLGFELEPGLGRWGTGDELLSMTHRGGEEILRDSAIVKVVVGPTSYSYSGAALLGGFSDGTLRIGEVWTFTSDMEPDTAVFVDVVSTRGEAHLLAAAQLRAGPGDCVGETTPPKVSGWTQAPSDVTAGTVGAVTVTATLADACSGLDPLVVPRLYYRLFAAPPAPAWTDAGAMTLLAGATWQAAVPAPGDGWDAHLDDTLEYRLDPLTDLATNSAPSETRTDAVQAGAASGQTLTYPSAYTAWSATVAGFANLQSASDAGAEASFAEVATGPGATTAEIHGTAHSNSGATTPAASTGAPDNAHTTLPGNNNWVGVSGFTGGTAAITKVEMAFEGHATTGSVSGGTDQLVLSYDVSGANGATTRSYNWTSLGSDADGPALFKDVTADRSWTWTDVAATRVKATFAKQTAEDTVDLKVDALWLRVEYTDAAYNMSARVDIAAVPAGSPQLLQLRYRTSGETFELQAWDWIALSWTSHGAQLTATTLTDWSDTLASDEINGTGAVQLRLRDLAVDAAPLDTLFIDYARVSTS